MTEKEKLIKGLGCVCENEAIAMDKMDEIIDILKSIRIILFIMEILGTLLVMILVTGGRR